MVKFADGVDIPESCILFATADWDEPYWTNKQHSAKALAELGVEVLYVESVGLRAPQVTSTRDWQRLRDRLTKGLRSFFIGAPRRAPKIRVLSPLLIPGGYRYVFTRCLNRWLLKFSIWRNTPNKSKTAPLIWTYHPFMMDILSNSGKSQLLYHCVDDLAAVPGIDAEMFRAAEIRLIKRADIVFATAPALAEKCSKYNSNTHFLSNVVDAEHFGKALEKGKLPDDLAHIPEPRLGYHGVLSDFKIDFELLLEAARLRPDWQWIFIGNEREGQKNSVIAKLKALPNVHFLGYRSYKELPNYLRGISVGLLPSLINEYTHSMFPMKFYEYLAAGIPVVSTKISFTKTKLEGVEVTEGMAEFIASISLQIEKGSFAKEEVERLVNNNTWRARTLKMLSALYGNRI